MKEKIYVVTHKPFQLSDKLKNKGYELITVGNVATSNEGVSDRDNVENIAYKNSNYCELTAVFWIWKNIHSNIKGFCHYRRFFSHNTFTYDENKIIGMDEVEKLLKNDTIILPEKKYYDMKSEELYLRCGYKKDLDTTRQVLREKYPEYVEDWDTMLKSNSGYLTNMMISQSGIFDEYCEWLFDILFEVEKRTNLQGYSKKEARIYGYLAERLLGIWVEHNQLQVIEFQGINSEKDIKLKLIMYRIVRRLGLYKTTKTAMWKIKTRPKFR